MRGVLAAPGAPSPRGYLPELIRGALPLRTGSFEVSKGFWRSPGVLPALSWRLLACPESTRGQQRPKRCSKCNQKCSVRTLLGRPVKTGIFERRPGGSWLDIWAALLPSVGWVSPGCSLFSAPSAGKYGGSLWPLSSDGCPLGVLYFPRHPRGNMGGPCGCSG